MAVSVVSVRSPTDADGTIVLTIPLHFYSSVWFVATVLVMAAALFWGFHHVRGRQIQGRLRARSHERERIARELHDTLLQSVQGLLLIVQASARETRENHVRDRLLHAVDELRGTVVETRARLQSLHLTDLGLNMEARLRETALQLGAVHSTSFRMRRSGPEVELDPFATQELFLILREMLVNAFQHAQSKHIWLTLRFGFAEFEGTVADDGIGIEAHVVRAGGIPGHWGLRNMRERAAHIQGAIELRTQPRAGTSVSIRVPAKRLYRHSRVGGLFHRRHISSAVR